MSSQTVLNNQFFDWSSIATLWRRSALKALSTRLVPQIHIPTQFHLIHHRQLPSVWVCQSKTLQGTSIPSTHRFSKTTIGTQHISEIELINHFQLIIATFKNRNVYFCSKKSQTRSTKKDITHGSKAVWNIWSAMIELQPTLSSLTLQGSIFAVTLLLPSKSCIALVFLTVARKPLPFNASFQFSYFLPHYLFNWLATQNKIISIATPRKNRTSHTQLEHPQQWQITVGLTQKLGEPQLGQRRNQTTRHLQKQQFYNHCITNMVPLTKCSGTPQFVKAH